MDNIYQFPPELMALLRKEKRKPYERRGRVSELVEDMMALKMLEEHLKKEQKQEKKEEQKKHQPDVLTIFLILWTMTPFVALMWFKLLY